MNKIRMEKIQKLSVEVSNLKDLFQSYLNEEQVYYDYLSEIAIESEKGEQSSNCVDSLSSIISSLEEVESELENLNNI